MPTGAIWRILVQERGRASMFDPTTLTGVHTWISLVAIATGLLVLAGLLGGNARPSATWLFLPTAVLTSVTGFFFPISALTPALVVGVIALAILAVTLFALFGRCLLGAWRSVYAIGVVASLYLLVFVAVAQAFAKVPALHALAPTQSEPPFAIAQGVVLLAFVFLGYRAVRALSGARAA